ncbi:hypothetical protein IV203_021483 [Nitzschia inconspicua]|uniref:DUF6824 domain-containing protein n=1 Tax=Nitzschia inconspicua TaxID=303405 RepID=A0A9K3K875_9STRA|nr:hypothetical protein IV203_022680 [Nitzschia inconspicua]KAG7343538.1 hypothetical protein IV203_021483 [Nitzschia inconspicua]
MNIQRDKQEDHTSDRIWIANARSSGNRDASTTTGTTQRVADLSQNVDTAANLDGNHHSNNPLHSKDVTLTVKKLTTTTTTKTMSTSTTMAPLTVSEMEKLTSKARMMLSFQERSRAMEDLHGISSKHHKTCSDESMAASSTTADKLKEKQLEQQHRQVLLSAMELQISKQKRMLQQSEQTPVGKTSNHSHMYIDYHKNLFPHESFHDDHDENDQDEQSHPDDNPQEQELRWAFLQSCCPHDTRLTADLFKSDRKYMNQVVERATEKYLQYQLHVESILGGTYEMHSYPQQHPLPLRYNHLSGSSQEIIQVGCFQALPQTDQACRRIVAIFPNQLPAVPPYVSSDDYKHALLAAALYSLSHVRFSDNNRDCVMIYYDLHDHASSKHPTTATNSTATAALQSILEICFQCLPMRWAALHIVQKRQSKKDDNDNCFVQMNQQTLPMFWKNLIPSLQVRAAFHFVDTAQEWKAELQGYGIRLSLSSDNKKESESDQPSSPLDSIEFPVDSNGTMHLERHSEWLQNVMQDDSASPREEEDEPMNFDDLEEWAAQTILEERKKQPLVSAGITMDPSIPSSANDSGLASLVSYPSLAPADCKMKPQAPAGTAIPGEKDVLFGRGMAIQRHAGNIAFRNRLTPNVDAYYEADNVEKVILVDYLLHKFQAEGIRFLKHEMIGAGAEPVTVASSSDGATLANAGVTITPAPSSSSATSSLDSSCILPSGNPQQDLIYHGKWSIVHSKQAIYSKFCQTFRSIRAAQRRQQHQQQHPKQQQPKQQQQQQQRQQF